MIATATTNAHIARLGELLGAIETPIDYLIIAHQDPMLQQRLESALCQESAVLLEVDQDSWQMEGGDLPAAIAWALENYSISHLVLVGHSAALLPDRLGLRLTPEESGGSRATLLDRVRNAEAARQRSADFFVRQLRHLQEIPDVGSRVTAGDLQLDGLFYQAESGAFMSYDEKTQSFALLN